MCTSSPWAEFIQEHSKSLVAALLGRDSSNWGALPTTLPTIICTKFSPPLLPEKWHPSGTQGVTFQVEDFLHGVVSVVA